MRHALPILLALSGCLVDQSRGPDLGDCASYPDGGYTYGEIGIGTCLAGPTDLRFIEDGDSTWLAVSNSDPFRSYTGGSVLLIDWSSVDTSRARQPISELQAGAVATDPYLGQLGHVGDTLLVASKFSEDSRTISDFDDVLAIDISDPASPTLTERVEVRQDPHPLAIDPSTGLAYVVNVTGTNVSILDLNTDPIETVSVSEGAAVAPARFFDEDHSGSNGEIGLAGVLTASAVPDERFTLTWIDVTQRAWLPSMGGVELWQSGGADWLPSSVGVLLEPDEGSGILGVTDPSFASVEGIPALHFADQGDIMAAVSAYGPADFSLASVATALQRETPGSEAGWYGAPTVLTFRDQAQLWFDMRPDEGEPAVIGRATLDLDARWSRDEIAIEPPEGFTSIEDPAPWPDSQTDGLRLFVSLFDGAQWSIGLADSADGESFSAVEEVLRLDGADAAAPVISWANGRYLMVLTISDGAAWHFATSWSWDGRSWSAPEPFATSTDAFDPASPPRAAISTDSQGFFRVEGHDVGFVDQPAISGATWVSGGSGFSIRPSTGHEVGLDPFGDAELSIEPASITNLQDRQILYALVTNTAGRTRLAAFEDDGGGLEPLSSDVLTVSGSIDGAVVTPTGSGFDVYFGQVDAEGITRLRRASSTDGLTFEVEPGNLLDDGAEWDGFAQVPHTVEDTGEGLRLWFAGSDGSRSRIGAARIEDGTLVREPGTERDWQLGSGLPGEFDDTGVRDPAVFTANGQLHMLYSGTDGTTSRLGHARFEAGEWVRDLHPVTNQPTPILLPVLRTFSDSGVSRPVLLSETDGEITVAISGDDGVSKRIGLAVGTPEQLFGAQRFPTAGDTLEFTTERGGPARNFIELSQATAEFTTSGLGATNAHFDEDRGFLYVPTRSAPHLIVLDVRDDSGAGETDRNFNDIEAVLRYSSTAGARGFRDAMPRPGHDLLYATASDPDGVLVFDLARVPDDSDKQALDDALVWSFPQGRAPQGDPDRPLQDEDEGAESLSTLTSSGMAMSPDGSLLLVAHARGNRVYVYDLELGAYGEEVRAIDGVGEFPHTVRISPDGRYAAVANYVGELTDDAGAQGTIAIIDLDSTSPTYLSVVTRLTNR